MGATEQARAVASSAKSYAQREAWSAATPARIADLAVIAALATLIETMADRLERPQ